MGTLVKVAGHPCLCGWWWRLVVGVWGPGEEKKQGIPFWNVLDYSGQLRRRLAGVFVRPVREVIVVPKITPACGGAWSRARRNLGRWPVRAASSAALSS